MHASKKDLAIGIISITIALATIGYARYPKGPSVPTTPESPSVASSTLPSITKDELARHDGSDPTLPIYVGLDGYVYDVSLGREFYGPGGPYHFLAGTDATRSLRIMGAETVRAKYPIIGAIAR